MKKTVVFLCVALLASFLIGCENKDASEKMKVGFVYVAPVGDAGWTWAHDQGKKMMEKDLGYVQTAKVENVPEGADATRVITQFAEQGFEVIFTTSFGYMDPTLEVAQRYPHKYFMHCSGYKVASNMGTYFGRIYQPRYLSGVVAGKMTKSNILGYVAAFPIPEVIRGINAFTLGVRSVNPKAEVRVVWTNTWYDPAKEKEAAESLLDLQADVLAQHQDSPAVQQAANDRGKYSVGYNADMTQFAPNAHLVAPIWNWGIVYKYTIEGIRQKTWKNEQIWWGIKEGLVDISPINEKLVSKDIIAFTLAKRQEIVNGTLEVFKGPIKSQTGEIKIQENQIAPDQDLLKMDYFVEGVVGTISKSQ